MQLFGWEVTLTKKEQEKKELVSFTSETPDDGAVTVAAGGTYGVIDLDGTSKTEADLISKYRRISLEPEIEEAINMIVNEAMAYDENDLVSINLDDLQGYSKAIKNRIEQEFKIVLRLLNFKHLGPRIFKRWYVDGRSYYHIIIDETKPEEGIKELRYIDPRKIRKIREVEKVMVEGMLVQRTKNEYFVYNDRGFGPNRPGALATDSAKGIRIAKDSILYTTSGLMNENNTMVLSYLQKAIKPLNQVRQLEDSSIIYFLVRAPERLIFYIDTGGLPKSKAEQHLNDQMTKHKNRLMYNSSTGEVRDDRRFMTMVDNYWFARQGNNKTTEVTPLAGGTQLTDLTQNIEYFLRRLYRSLNVPASRFEQNPGFLSSKTTEITRDELDFFKFIVNLRKEFCNLFSDALRKQLVLKQIISEDEWPMIEEGINYTFASDNAFTELKWLDTFSMRVQILAQLDNYVGTYFSQEYIKKKVLGQTDDEIEEIAHQIAVEGPPPNMEQQQNEVPYGPEDNPSEPPPGEDEEDNPNENQTFHEI